MVSGGTGLLRTKEDEYFPELFSAQGQLSWWKIVFPLLCIIVCVHLFLSLHESNIVLLACSLVVAALVVFRPPHSFKAHMFAIALLLEAPFYTLNYFYPWWFYRNPTPILGFPVWEPILFTVEFLLIAELTVWINMALKRCPVLIYRLIITVMAAVILVYTGYTLLTITPVLAYGAGMIFFILLFFAHAPFNILLFVVAAVIGVAVDYTAVREGVWGFTAPYFTSTGIPLSSFLAYGVSANTLWVISLRTYSYWNRDN